MNTTVKTDNNQVTISLSGRLDTATSAETSAIINNALDKLTDISSVTCDATELEYISSSGLRILLSLAKRFPGFRVTDVKPKVYGILETTGFTKIMTVERAMRRLSVEGCRLIGVGGVGKVYRLDGDTIIKVFREGTTIEEVRGEITMSKEAFVLGMPTAISFDIVKVEPSTEVAAESYGLVYELLQAQTLSTYARKHPEKLDECAVKYAEVFQQLHQIDVPTDGNIPSAIKREREQILHIRRYFPQENIDKLLSIVDSMPAGNRLLHLDLQTKNVMMQDEEPMLIDMGEVGYGHPMLDLGHAYSAMVGFIGEYEKTLGITREMGREIWDKAMNRYFANVPADVKAERLKQIEVISLIRNFSWLSLSDSFPQDLVQQCKDAFDERITQRYDYIMSVCKTFDNWKL